MAGTLLKLTIAVDVSPTSMLVGLRTMETKGNTAVGVAVKVGIGVGVVVEVGIGVGVVVEVGAGVGVDVKVGVGVGVCASRMVKL